MIEAVVFDCDGVLFDSSGANVAFFTAVLHRAGLPPMPPAWERRAHTMAASQLLDALLADDPDALARCRVIARKLDYAPFYPLMIPAPDLHDVLAALRQLYRLAMASNRGRTASEVVQRFGLDAYFTCTVGALDVPHPKPAPDMIDACLRRLGSRATASVYVGDADSDRAAAEAAGVHFVAMGSGCAAPHHITTLTELPELLTRLAAGPPPARRT